MPGHRQAASDRQGSIQPLKPDFTVAGLAGQIVFSCVVTSQPPQLSVPLPSVILPRPAFRLPPRRETRPAGAARDGSWTKSSPQVSRPPPLLPFDQIGAEQLQWDGATREITFYSPVSQVFTCARPDFHRLEVFIEKHSGLTRSHLWLKLFEGDVTRISPAARRAPDRFVGPLATETLLSHGWFAFEFAPIARSGGRIFTAVFEAPDATPGNALALRSASHAAGGLGVGGQPGTRALLFRAVCLRAPQLWANFERFRVDARQCRGAVSHQPLMAQIEVSRRCNLNCVFCYRGANPFDAARDSPGFMTLRTFRALDPILPGLLWLIAFGLGEPFLNPEYLDILRHARRMNPIAHIFTSTNGTCVDEESIRAMVAEDLVSDFQVSVGGANRATFERIRRNANYATVRRTLERLIVERDRQGRHRMTTRASMVVMRPNASEVYEFIRQMAAMGVDRILLDSPKGDIGPGLRIEDAAELARVYDQVEHGFHLLKGTHTSVEGPLLMELRAWHHASGRRGSPPEFDQDPCAWTAGDTSAQTSRCGVPWESMTFGPDGIVRVCCNSYRPMKDEASGSVSAVWAQGRPYQKLREEIVRHELHADCRRCQSDNVAKPNSITPPTYWDTSCLVDRSATAWPDLLGRRIGRLETGDAANLGVEIEEVAFRGGGQANEPPGWRLGGWLNNPGAVDGEIILAIGVDHVIRGIAATVAVSAEFAWWSTVMEGVPRPKSGRRIDVFRVIRGGPQLRLERIAKHCRRESSVPAKSRFPAETRPPWWSDWEDLPKPSSPASVQGFIDEVRIGGGVVTLRGWARDTETRAPASRVVVLLAGKPLRAVRPWLSRPDVAQAFGEPPANYGFIIEIPLSLLRKAEPSEITVIALNDRQAAAELVWSGQRGVIALADDSGGRDRQSQYEVSVERAQALRLRRIVGTPPARAAARPAAWLRGGLVTLDQYLQRLIGRA